MYPEGLLVNYNKKNIIEFEKDLTNPNHEGFISIYKFKSKNKKKLIFKKRTTKITALNKWKSYIIDGWEKTINFGQAS